MTGMWPVRYWQASTLQEELFVVRVPLALFTIFRVNIRSMAFEFYTFWVLPVDCCCCIPCKGVWWDITTGVAGCTPCTAGFFANKTGRYSLRPFRRDGGGRTIYLSLKCLLSNFIPSNAGMTICISCALGTYSSSKGERERIISLFTRHDMDGICVNICTPRKAKDLHISIMCSLIWYPLFAT